MEESNYNYELIEKEFWEQMIEPILNPIKKKAKESIYKQDGRPKSDDRMIFSALIYRAIFKISWKKIPESFGSRSVIHSRFKVWSESGRLLKVKKAVCGFYEIDGIKLDWTYLEGKRVKTSVDNDPKGKSKKKL
ncbi:transposase [Leptospira sp. SA-E8]|uniref:transposase n=1 Tax=Leptospira sp. SA-E8 TaxID=3422259 RepID=UPI003EBCAAA7